MRNHSCILIFALLSISLQAQITITRNDFPVAGDTSIIYSSIETVYTGVSGADVTWDLSEVTFDMVNTQVVVYSANLHSYNHIPYVTIEEDYAASGISYEIIEYNYYYNLGNHSSHQSKEYPGGRVQMSFPFTFNSYFADTSYFNWVSEFFSPIPFYSSGSGLVMDSSFCDGWGKLILPIGTFDAIRVHSFTGVSTDSSTFGNLWYTDQEFAWFTNQFKGPLVRMIPKSSGGWEIYLYTNPAHLFGVTPPADPSLIVNCFMKDESGQYELQLKNCNSDNVELKLYDLLGKKMFEKQVSLPPQSNQTLTVDMAGYEKGIYLLSVEVNSRRYTLKLYNSR